MVVTRVGRGALCRRPWQRFGIMWLDVGTWESGHTVRQRDTPTPLPLTSAPQCITMSLLRCSGSGGPAGAHDAHCCARLPFHKCPLSSVSTPTRLHPPTHEPLIVAGGAPRWGEASGREWVTLLVFSPVAEPTHSSSASTPPPPLFDGTAEGNVCGRDHHHGAVQPRRASQRRPV
jgi:hypothetical protein